MITITKRLTIQTEYIPLGQMLKHANLISSGGAAKWYLLENRVFVNGNLETRRGRKLYPDDEIHVTGHGTYLITR